MTFLRRVACVFLRPDAVVVVVVARCSGQDPQLNRRFRISHEQCDLTEV